jgi:hypothetical protein
MLVELHTGEPLFAGRTEADLVWLCWRVRTISHGDKTQTFRTAELLSMPPDWMIETSPKQHKVSVCVCMRARVTMLAVTQFFAFRPFELGGAKYRLRASTSPSGTVSDSSVWMM